MGRPRTIPGPGGRPAQFCRIRCSRIERLAIVSAFIRGSPAIDVRSSGPYVVATRIRIAAKRG